MLAREIKIAVMAVLLSVVGASQGGCSTTGRHQPDSGKSKSCCWAKRGLELGYAVNQEQTLSDQDLQTVLDQAQAAANREPSLLRVGENGDKKTCRMHIILVDRTGRVVARRSMADAWAGSVAVAKAKAFTAMAFSSDENALSTRTIGVLSQPGGPLWQIGNVNHRQGTIEFPGGLPLYKNGVLVGGIGVSGDGVEQDERVAQAGSNGFEPPAVIRVDTVTGGTVPYLQ